MDTAVSEMQGMNTMQYKYADTCIKLSYNHAILQYHMYKYPPHPHHRARVTGRKKEREQKVKAVFMSAQARRASREPGPRIEGGIYIYVCVCGVPRTHRAPKRPHLFCFGVPQVWEKYMELAHWLVQASYTRPNVVRFHNSIPFVLSHQTSVSHKTAAPFFVRR